MSAPAQPWPEPEAFERAVLSAFGFTPEDAPLVELAQAYQVLSRSLLKGELAGGPSGLLDPQLDPRLLGAVWALIYGARSFEIGRRVLAAYPPGPGKFCELGAGWGPLALAARLLGGLEVEAVDLSAGRLAAAPALFSAFGVEPPRAMVCDATAHSTAGAGGVGLPFSLLEMFRHRPRPVDDGARWLGERLLELGPGGRIYVLEAGSRDAARWLQSVRDALAARFRILAPCPGAGGCPSLLQPDDWCHLTWRHRPGPFSRRLADRAERRWQELHFSWLVLSADPPLSVSNEARLIELRSRGKAKLEARVCTAHGLEAWTVLRRHRDVFDALAGQEPGAVLEADPDQMTTRGDGLRLENAAAFRALRSL